MPIKKRGSSYHLDDKGNIVLDLSASLELQESSLKYLNCVSNKARQQINLNKPILSEETKLELHHMNCLDDSSTINKATMVLSFTLVGKTFSEYPSFNDQNAPILVEHDVSDIIFPASIAVKELLTNKKIGYLDKRPAAIIFYASQNNLVRIIGSALSDDCKHVQLELQVARISDFDILLKIIPSNFYTIIRSTIVDQRYEINSFDPELFSSNIQNDINMTQVECKDNYMVTRSQMKENLFGNDFCEETFKDKLQNLSEITDELMLFLKHSDELIYIDTRKRFTILCDINMRCIQEELTGFCNKPLSAETSEWCSEGCARIGVKHYENWFRKMFPLSSSSSCHARSREYRAGGDFCIAKKAITAQVKNAHALQRKELIENKLKGIENNAKPIERFLYTVLMMDGTGIEEGIQANHNCEFGKTIGTTTLTSMSKTFQVLYTLKTYTSLLIKFNIL